MIKWRAERTNTCQTAEYARQVACFVCEGANRFDVEFCRHCRAPMALAYGAEAARKRPELVAVIGAPGAGKTVYLGMLTDMLSRQHGGLQILARGAFSVTLQQQSVAALSRRRFPPSTPSEPAGWHWVHCEVSGLPKRRTVELILPDLSGTAFMSEIENADSHQVIRSFLSKCSAAIVLIDTDRLDSGDQEQDLMTMKIVSYLLELSGDRRNGWPQRPVAMVFSKADCSDVCDRNPTAFAEHSTPGLWRLCQERLRRHRFFAASVTGASVQVRLRSECFALPLRVEPRGVVEPFMWLVEQLAK